MKPDDPTELTPTVTLQGQLSRLLASLGSDDAGSVRGVFGAWPELVGEAVAALGRLDHLVNNAGTAHVREPVAIQDLDAVTDELWDAVLATNLRGTFACSRAAAPALKAARGGITSIASVAGLTQPGSSMAYGASKAGVISLTRNLARALAPELVGEAA